MGWHSIWLLLLLLVAPFSSASSNKKVAEGRLIFDCTQVINDLLLNDNSSPESISLLQVALNKSDTIYYGWDASVEHLFPEKVLRIADILESSGWRLGVAGDDGERTIMLSISVSKSFQYFKRLVNQTIIENQTEMHELLLPKFDKVKLYFLNESRPMKIKIIISFSYSSENSCDLFTDPQAAVGVATYAHAIRHLLGSTLDTTGVEYNENQMMTCGNVFLPPPPSTNKNSSLAMMLSIELVTAQRLPESYGLFSDLMKLLLEKNENFVRLNPSLHKRGPLRLQLKPSFNKGSSTSSFHDKRHIERGYATLLSRFAVRWTSESEETTIIIEATEPIISNLGGSVEDIVPTMRDTVIPNLDNSLWCNNEDLNYLSPELSFLIAQRFKLVYFQLPSESGLEECVGRLHRCSRATTEDESEGRNCKNLFQHQPAGNNSLKLLIDAIDLDERDWGRNAEPDFQKALRLFRQYRNNTTAELPIKAILFGQRLSSEDSVRVIAGFKEVITDEQFGCSIPHTFTLTYALWKGNDSALANLLADSCNLPKKVNLIIVLDLTDSLNMYYTSRNVSHYTSVVQPLLSVAHSAVRKLQTRFPAVSVILKLPRVRISHLDKSSQDEYHSLFCSTEVANVNTVVEAVVTWSYIHKLPVILKSGLLTTTSYVDGSPFVTYPGWWDSLGPFGSGSGGRAFKTRNHPKTMMGYLQVEPCLEGRLEGPPQSPIPLFTSGMGCTIHVSKLLVEPRELQLMLDFALHKFSNVEIIIPSNNFNQVIGQLLKPMLLSSSSSHHEHHHHIFLQVPLENLPGVELQSEMLLKVTKRLVEELKSNKSGAKISIQISNWEGLDHEADQAKDLLLETFVQLTMAAGVQLGVVISNCSSSASILERGILADMNFVHYFSFLVCATTWKLKYYYYGQTYNKRNYFSTMSAALDQLYLTQAALRRKFPDKEIYFRPEFHTSNTADFLRTLWDVNEHARLYNMKYFAVNAFEYTSSDRSSSWKQGWWKVDSNATNDLSNPFNYFERESEHLSQSPWRPPTRGKQSEVEASSSWWTYYVSMGGGCIMVILSLVWLTVWKWKKSRLLTRIEELEFLNGVSPDMSDDDLDGSPENQFLDMRFDKKFEIPKTNLESDEATIIGTGNFGVVYKAVVKEELVGVKVPKEGSSPNQFKSTLQEIKIMCYVGCHENVVRFVGAYIKEIRRGIVQVATELCENGTLLSHLRQLSRSICGTEGEEESLSEFVAAFDLNTFALEVASGMEYLSRKRVIHGDLATRNVLLDEHFTCKIGDFGLSRKLVEYEKYVKESEEPLPWRWMAYETLDKREFSVKSDVWSYGVTLWEIYSLGSVPYPDLNWTADFLTSLHSGYRLQKPKYSTDDLYGKLLDCWHMDADSRPTFLELCQYFRTLRETQYMAMEVGEEDAQHS